MKIDTILSAHITEKSLLASRRGLYTFLVSKSATKDAIAKSIESLFKVKVDSVRTNTRKGKVKSVGKKRTQKPLSDKKYAFVKLESGKIDLFPTT